LSMRERHTGAALYTDELAYKLSKSWGRPGRARRLVLDTTAATEGRCGERGAWHLEGVSVEG
jgi:hypothetical protein